MKALGTKCIAATFLALASYAVGAAECPENLDFRFKTLAGTETVHLCEEFAGKVVLLVNTASKCGYTPQYDGLEAIYEKYRERGFVVVGFPSNDFGRQEPGNAAEIQAFCRLTYGVRFPMMEKTGVREGVANALYVKLAEVTGEYPQWNFHKYLLDRDGRVVASFRSSTDPRDPQLVDTIERLVY